MTLKGYQWEVDGVVVMIYLFKDETIHVLHDTTLEEHTKFYKFLETKNIIANSTNCHWGTLR